MDIWSYHTHETNSVDLFLRETSTLRIRTSHFCHCMEDGKQGKSGIQRFEL